MAKGDKRYIIVWRKPKGDWQARPHLFYSEVLATKMLKIGLSRVSEQDKKVREVTV